MGPRVALATCEVLPEPDPDEAPLLDALTRRGARAFTLAWDEQQPRHDGDPPDMCVLRATWNYYQSPEAFLRWCAEIDRQTLLLNPVAAVRWNLHKGYLQEIEALGVPIVPTTFVARNGDARTMGDLCALHKWRDIVVKPAVSAASFMTRRIVGQPNAEHETWWRKAVAERDMMIQPYMSCIETSGERSIIWIDGEISHAVRKSPRFASSEESISVGTPPDAQERDLVERALGAAPPDVRKGLLYARIDLMRAARAEPVISEVELIEPSLYFALHDPAADCMAAAILRRLA